MWFTLSLLLTVVEFSHLISLSERRKQINIFPNFYLQLLLLKDNFPDFGTCQLSFNGLLRIVDTRKNGGGTLSGSRLNLQSICCSWQPITAALHQASSATSKYQFNTIIIILQWYSYSYYNLLLYCFYCISNCRVDVHWITVLTRWGWNKITWPWNMKFKTFQQQNILNSLTLPEQVQIVLRWKLPVVVQRDTKNKSTQMHNKSMISAWIWRVHLIFPD